MKKLYLFIVLTFSLSNVYGSDIFECEKNLLEYEESVANNNVSNKIIDMEEYDVYLKELGTIKNTSNMSHNMKAADANSAFNNSSFSIQLGVSYFLDENLKLFQKSEPIIDLAKSYSTQLRYGTSIEKLDFDKKEWNETKLIFQTVLNNFCWQDGKTTEVTLEEVAANMILRKRITDFITINDQ